MSASLIWDWKRRPPYKVREPSSGRSVACKLKRGRSTHRQSSGLWRERGRSLLRLRDTDACLTAAHLSRKTLAPLLGLETSARKREKYLQEPWKNCPWARAGNIVAGRTESAVGFQPCLPGADSRVRRSQ